MRRMQPFELSVGGSEMRFSRSTVLIYVYTGLSISAAAFMLLAWFEICVYRVSRIVVFAPVL